MAETTGCRARLDLSGPWQLAFDPDDEGIGSRWPAGNWPHDSAETVQVPALWNVTHPDAEGVGFYRRTFTVADDWQGRVLQLHFGGASYRADVWLNGAYAGSHEGAYTPFELDVTSLARAGAENELVVRVAALSKTRDVDGMVLIQSPASKQSWYYTAGGLWGEVYLEALPLLSCQAANVEPDPRREVAQVEVVISNRSAVCRRPQVRLQVTAPDGSLAAEERSQVTAPPGTSRPSYRLPLPRPMLWDCENPNLYTLQVTIEEDGTVVDRRSVRFGMREFTVRDGRFYLNGAPIYLRGLLLQPNYPVTDIVPPTREMMVREITLAKEAGFNLIRAHIRPAPPGYLDLADEKGMLVYAESCLAWIKDSPRLLDHGRRELQALIERDRNHPSVVFWGIHNENRDASALTSEVLIRHVRALDPTRVIVDNSGGSMAIDQDFGWVDRATVVPSWQTEREAIQDLHIYVGAPIPAGVYEWMRTLGISDLPLGMAAHDFGSRALLDEWNRALRAYQGQVFVSELGCGGLPDLDAVVAGFAGQEHLRDAREMKAFRDSLHEGFRARRLERVFGSVAGLIRASQQVQVQGLTRQIEALLANRRVSGYVVTQLNDLWWEFHAGLLDHWRNPKPAYHAVKRLHQPHCLILKAAPKGTSPSAYTCGEAVEVALTLVSREPLRGTEEIVVAIYDPEGRPFDCAQGGLAGTQRRPAPRGTGIKDLGSIVVETGQAAGEWRVTARLLREGETLAEAAEAILALPPVDLTEFAGQVECVGEVPPAFAVAQARQAGELRVLLAPRPATLVERDWSKLLDRVAGGQVAIIGPLHKRDALAQRLLQERGVNLRLNMGIGSWMGCFHWLAEAALTAGLPATGLAGEAFVDVLPWWVLSELGGDVLAGSLRNTMTRFEPPAMLWYSDVEAISFGQGTLIFCQYRVFEQAHSNALAGTLVRNLVRLAQQYQPRSREDSSL